MPGDDVVLPSFQGSTEGSDLGRKRLVLEVGCEAGDELVSQHRVVDLIDASDDLFGVCVMVAVSGGARSLFGCPADAVAVWHMCGPAGRVGTVRRDLIGAWSIPNRRVSTERSLRPPASELGGSHDDDSRWRRSQAQPHHRGCG